MTKKALIIYSTTDGQTKKIAEYIAEKLSDSRVFDISLLNLTHVNENDIQLSDYDAVVLGASIRYGKHNAAVEMFINQHAATLSKQSYAFFSVNLTARKPEKSTPETSQYTQKLYKRLAVLPNVDAVFAGKLNYPRYRFFDKHIIRFIMMLTGGPTDLSTVKEYTDWTKVDAFTDDIKNSLE